MSYTIISTPCSVYNTCFLAQDKRTGAERGWSLKRRYTFPSEDIKPTKTTLSVHWPNLQSRRINRSRIKIRMIYPPETIYLFETINGLGINPNSYPVATLTYGSDWIEKEGMQSGLSGACRESWEEAEWHPARLKSIVVSNPLFSPKHVNCHWVQVWYKTVVYTNYADKIVLGWFVFEDGLTDKSVGD